MKRWFVVSFVVVVVLALSGCAAGPNELVNVPNAEGQVAGFWQGLGHGLVSPIAFLISLFSDSVQVYQAHNNGGWYNFGFLLGASIIFGGSGGGGAAAARRR
ncbi:MAG: hypothetical protein GYB67_17100 [Chloroflexi bacterium]|nr:hypothetical protein [Chloroflexota bacterium]